MTFLHPIMAALGIACIAIPILLHLLMRRKRRPVVFAAMRFVIEAYNKQRKRLTLEQLLLLLTRIALVALIALGLAGPMLSSAKLPGNAASQLVFILVDDSLNATLTTRDSASELSGHIDSALDVMHQLNQSTPVALILLSTPPRVAVSLSTDHAAVIRAIEAIEPADAQADITGALSLVEPLPDLSEADATIVLLSSLRKGSINPQETIDDISQRFASLTLIATSPSRLQPASNITITQLEPMRRIVLTGNNRNIAPEPIQLRIELSRSGPIVRTKATTTINASIESGRSQSASTQASVRWQPGQEQAFATLSLSDPSLSGQPQDTTLAVRIDNDALLGDNLRRAVIQLRQQIRVGVVSSSQFLPDQGVAAFAGADWVRAALAPAPGSPITTIDIKPLNIDPPTLASIDALLIAEPDQVPANAWPDIATFVQRGGSAVVLTPANQGVHLWHDAMRSAFNLPWTIAREPMRLDQPAALNPSPDQQGKQLLAMIAGEYEALAQPVSIWQRLSAYPENPNDIVLRTADGDPIMLAVRPSQDTSDYVSSGLVIFLAVALDPDWTNLPAKPLFVPLVHELIRASSSRSLVSRTRIAGQRLSGPLSQMTLTKASASSGPDRIDPPPTQVARAVSHAGIWQLHDATGRSRGIIAFNPDPHAGNTSISDEKTIIDWLSNALHNQEPILLDEQSPADAINTQMQQTNTGDLLSLPLLIAALVLAIIETCLARIASHARKPIAGVVT